MPSIDMPLEQLRQYKPALYREADFESFWESTTAEALKQPINAELIPYDLRTKGLVCYAVRFDGFKGADKQQQGGRIAGWYVRPEAERQIPRRLHLPRLQRPRPAPARHARARRPGHLRPVDGLPRPERPIAGRRRLHRRATTGLDDAGHPRPAHLLLSATSTPTRSAPSNCSPSATRWTRARIAVTGVSQGGGLSLAVAALSERPAPALAGHPVPLRLPPRDRHHARRAVPRDPRVPQELPAPVRETRSAR